MTVINRVVHRYSNLILKKADIDLRERADDISDKEIEKEIMFYQAGPFMFALPSHFTKIRQGA